MPRKLFSYNRFLGLDTVTSPSNMSERFLTELQGGYVDFRGQIVKGPLFQYAINGNNSNFSNDKHYNIKHYGRDDFCRYIFNQTLTSAVGIEIHSNTVTQTNAFVPTTAPITPISLVNFDQKQFSFMAGHDPYFYDGIVSPSVFTNVTSVPSPQYSSLGVYPKGGHAVNILNRLVVAGIPGRETEIHVSAQDSYTDWRTNTSSGTTPNATDGAIIDVKNQFTSNDTIKGLAVLEGDKLVIFGENEILVYLADTNINLWEIARDFRVPIGIFGRNTAVNVGTDLFFCSRFGIHSLKRAASGLTLEAMTFTREIEDFYQSVVSSVPTGTGYSNVIFSEPHAVWDGGIGQYRVFFPQDNSGNNYKEIRFTYDPEAGRSGHASFSTSGPSFGFEGKHVTCGSYFARADIGSGNIPPPSLLLGASNGFGDGRAKTFGSSNNISSVREFVVRTPLLSQGSPDTYKHYKRLIIRAVGTSEFNIKIFDSENNQVQFASATPEADGFASTSVSNPNNFGYKVDSTRPIEVPIPHRAKSISIQFETSTSVQDLKILDFALVVDTK